MKGRAERDILYLSDSIAQRRLIDKRSSKHGPWQWLHAYLSSLDSINLRTTRVAVAEFDRLVAEDIGKARQNSTNGRDMIR